MKELDVARVRCCGLLDQILEAEDVDEGDVAILIAAVRDWYITFTKLVIAYRICRGELVFAEVEAPEVRWRGGLLDLISGGPS